MEPDKICVASAIGGTLRYKIHTADGFDLETIYEDKLDKKITEEFYQRKFQEWTKELEELRGSLAELGEANVHYYQAGFAIHQLALKAKEIYESKEASTDDKRLLLSQVFSKISLEGDQVTGDYTEAFEFLAEWMPKVNRIFEPKLATANTQELAHIAGKVAEKVSVMASMQIKDFRTEENSSIEHEKVLSATESKVLFRDGDSNPNFQIQSLASCR